MSLDLTSFWAEMKAYVGFSAADAAVLGALAPLMEPHVAALADRFYEEIPKYPDAAAVFTGGEAQIARLKLTLQRWARGLFEGVYDEAYAQERFRIGFRHVQIRLPQRYVIAAMSVVEQFIREVFDREIADAERRRQAHTSLGRILSLDLNLICETYFEASVRELRSMNEALATTNQSLERANRVKGDFLATVSHELRTPLTAIVGFSRLLAEERVDEASRRREFARDIHGSALSLLGIVDEILDVSRIDAGRVEMTLSPVSVAGVVEHVVAGLSLEANRKGLALTGVVPPEVPDVRADHDRLKQVLTNLVGNAIKFTDRGFIQVSAGRSPEGGSVVIRVEDSGIGIAPELIPGLFEKFRQADASHTRRYGGVGLGLAICKALVGRMDGTISLASDGLGTGTTATVTLPVALTGPRVAADRAELAHVPHVLLVADDEKARTALAHALRLHGYLVLEGATMDGVRAMVRTEQIDVLILDVAASPGQARARLWCQLLIELEVELQGASPRTVVLTDGLHGGDSTRVEMDLLVVPRATILQKPSDAAVLHAVLRRVITEPHRPLRLLVVDDDPLVYKFASQILPAADYALLYAPSGSEALTMLAAHPIDGILLDLRMPDGSGYDLMRDLKLRGRPSQLPIVILTNYPEPATDEERGLLEAPFVIELFAKTAVARDPQPLIDRLAQLREGT